MATLIDRLLEVGGDYGFTIDVKMNSGELESVDDLAVYAVDVNGVVVEEGPPAFVIIAGVFTDATHPFEPSDN